MNSTPFNPKTLDEVKWPVQNVQAFATTRHHPFQQIQPSYQNTFSAFNLGDHVQDQPAKVIENRQKLQTLFTANKKIQWLKQVHGDQVLTLENHSACPLTADAVITQKKAIVLAIMTADCLPILLADIKGKEIAAIHGGWRPLALNIISKTVMKMATPYQSICAWLGPCIGKTAFEVGEDVHTIFVRQNLEFQSAFTQISTHKYLADLQQIASIQLQQLGINAIYQHSACTFSMPERYFSYRRMSQTGRMATMISCN